MEPLSPLLASALDAPDPTKHGAWHEVEATADLRYPAFLLDLDDTLVQTRGASHPSKPGEQYVLPNRLKVLKQLKEKGYKLIGITNRSDFLKEETLNTVIELIKETVEILGGLLDDVLFIPFASRDMSKPNPLMLRTAIDRYQLDQDNVVMVGNSEDDQEAAARAGVAFTFAEPFFMECDIGLIPPAKPRLMKETPEGWLGEQNGPELEKDFAFDDDRMAKDFLSALNQYANICNHHPHFAQLDGRFVRVILATHEPEKHVSYKDLGLAHWLNRLHEWGEYEAWGEEVEDDATRGASRKPRHYRHGTPNPTIEVPAPKRRPKDTKDAITGRLTAGFFSSEKLDKEEEARQKKERFRFSGNGLR